MAQLDRKYAGVSLGATLSRLVSYALFEGRPATTRGRWLNPVARAYQAGIGGLGCRRDVNSPAYIVGVGRSGTTVLGKILSLHPQVGWLNEPKLMWHRINPADDLIGSYGGDDPRVWLDANDADSRQRELAHRLFGAYLWSIRRTRLVDKYPEMVFRIPYVKAIFPDARFILLVRRCASVISSVAKWNLGHAMEGSEGLENWWGVDSRKWRLLAGRAYEHDPHPAFRPERLELLRDDAGRATVEWLLAVRAGLASVRNDSEDSILVVRYEDLTRQPEATVNEIFRFAGLEPAPRVSRYASEVLTPATPVDAGNVPEQFRDMVAETEAALGYER